MEIKNRPCEEHTHILPEGAKKDFVICDKCGYKVWRPLGRGRSQVFNPEARWRSKR